ncbi:MAG: HIT family protein [Acidimicrobiia bacterium]
MGNECIFCQIARGQAPASRVYEDDQVVAFLDIHPVTPGHTLVIPLEHSAGLAELDPTLGRHMFTVASRVAAAIRASDLPSEGINLFLADGAAAGQEVFHTHLHVFARFRGDGFGIRAQRELPEREVLDGHALSIQAAFEQLDRLGADSRVE